LAAEFNSIRDVLFVRLALLRVIFDVQEAMSDVLEQLDLINIDTMHVRRLKSALNTSFKQLSQRNATTLAFTRDFKQTS
jgi:hypothetical protein